MAIYTATPTCTDTLANLGGGDGLPAILVAANTAITAGSNPGHTHTLAQGASDVTASAVEVSYTDGVTSAIQTQIDGKAATAHTHLLAAGATDVTSSAAELNVLDGIPVTLTATELGYVDGVTSAIQTQINTKAPTASPSFTGDVNIATGSNIQVNSADPFRTIVLPSGSMSPTTTAGCASVATVEAGTNDVDYKVLDFDTTTVESAWVLFQMPNNWDGGTITFKPVWTAASGSGTVCFGLKGRAYADDDAIDQAYGTEQTSTDTLITAGDVHIGPESSAITLAGAPAGGQLVQLKITRQTGSDTLGVDARLIGIRILYKIAQYSD